MGSCSSSGLVDELQQWLILSLLWSMVITSIGSLTCKKYELCDTRDGSLVYSDFCSCREPRFISQNPHGGLPIPINSSFWPPRALPIYMVCKHMCKPTLIHIKIIAKNLKEEIQIHGPHMECQQRHCFIKSSMEVHKPGVHMSPSLVS